MSRRIGALASYEGDPQTASVRRQEMASVGQMRRQAPQRMQFSESIQM